MTRNKDSDRIVYPTLPDPLQSSELLRSFTPTPVEVDWTCPCRINRAECSRVLTLSTVFQTQGRFIPHTRISGLVDDHVSRCVGLPDGNANEISGRMPTLNRRQHLNRECVGVDTWNAGTPQQVKNKPVYKSQPMFHHLVGRAQLSTNTTQIEH